MTRPTIDGLAETERHGNGREAVGPAGAPISHEAQVRHALQQVLAQLSPWLEELVVVVVKAKR